MAVLCLLLGMAVFLTAGCGYQFRVQGKGPVIGEKSGDAQAATRGPTPRMLVSNFENKTYEPNLEIKFTNYTRQELASGGGVQIVNSPQAADLILKAQIVGVGMPSVSFNQETTFESRVTVTVKTTVEDARTKQAVWSDTATASSEFFITQDVQLNRVLQSRALEQAGRYIAGDVATRFLAHLDAGGGVNAEKTPPPPPKKAVPSPEPKVQPPQ